MTRKLLIGALAALTVGAWAVPTGAQDHAKCCTKGAACCKEHKACCQVKEKMPQCCVKKEACCKTHSKCCAAHEGHMGKGHTVKHPMKKAPTKKPHH